MHLIVDDTAVGEVTGVHFLKGFEDRRVRLEIAERIQLELAEADARIREEHRLLNAETFQEIGDSSHTVVYFTKDGKRYHKEKNCSNMKDPIVGTIDEVGERTPCKKCYN